MINMELNITLQCNMACPNCNRLCHVYRDRTEHMKLEQIQKFIDQIRNSDGVHKLKILGGEPLLHPQFAEVYNIILPAVKDGAIQQIKIETNQTIPYPKVEEHKNITWHGRSQARKKHQPALWSPIDLGFKTNPYCKQIGTCGFSLDKYGYLPCSLAIMISRLYGVTHLYRYELPTEAWGLNELCKHCVFSMPKAWRHQYASKNILQHTEEDQTPTKSYKEAMERWDAEEFYKNQKEF
jgi:hypothetical protein